MSNNYVLSCCSTADLTEEHFKKRNINYICSHYELDGKQYLDDLGKSITFPKFYELLSQGHDAKTSQINIGEFGTYFKSFLEKGLDILHVSMSSGLSGVFNSASIAKNSLLEQYPERKIYIVDSLAVSSGYGLIMDKLADFRDSGANIEDSYKWINENKLKVHHWFFFSFLSFYVKGGRLSPIAGTIGGLLKICPLLNVDNVGKLVPRSKVRGKRKVIQEMVSKMEQFADNGLNYNDKCYISHSHCYDDAKNVSDLIEQKFQNLKGKIEINYVGNTIGSHTGPGTVALFFVGSKRID